MAALLALMSWPIAASAQSSVPRLEIGARAGGLVAVGADGGFGIGIGPHISIRPGRLWSIDLAADVLTPSDSGGLSGFYQLLLSRVARRDGSSANVRVSVGLFGWFLYDRVGELRSVRPDGSTVVYRPRTHAYLEQPAGAVFGVSFRRPVARRAAVRSDLQAFIGRYVVLHAAVGLVVPIGGHYVR